MPKGIVYGVARPIKRIVQPRIIYKEVTPPDDNNFVSINGSGNGSRLRRRKIKRCVKTLSLFLALLLASSPAPGQTFNPAAHTDPINLTPQVRDAFEHYYSLDFDGA